MRGLGWLGEISTAKLWWRERALRRAMLKWGVVVVQLMCVRREFSASNVNLYSRWKERHVRRQSQVRRHFHQWRELGGEKYLRCQALATGLDWYRIHRLAQATEVWMRLVLARNRRVTTVVAWESCLLLRLNRYWRWFRALCAQRKRIQEMLAWSHSVSDWTVKAVVIQRLRVHAAVKFGQVKTMSLASEACILRLVSRAMAAWKQWSVMGKRRPRAPATHSTGLDASRMDVFKAFDEMLAVQRFKVHRDRLRTPPSEEEHLRNQRVEREHSSSLTRSYGRGRGALSRSQSPTRTSAAGA